jgi:hypothetical protein
LPTTTGKKRLAAWWTRRTTPSGLTINILIQTIDQHLQIRCHAPSMQERHFPIRTTFVNLIFFTIDEPQGISGHSSLRRYHSGEPLPNPGRRQERNQETLDGIFWNKRRTRQNRRDISAIAEGKPTSRTRSAPAATMFTGVFPATSHAFSAGCAA